MVQNDKNGDDKYPAQMIVDACSAADAAGLDFTQYDTDNDGYVDNVFVYYAGFNEAESSDANTIWPDRWSVSEAGISSGITYDGKKIEDYSCTSELKGSSGI
jgi:M6 family metalloprotease-like protein